MKNLLLPLGLAASLFSLPAAAGELILGATGFNANLVADMTQDLTSTASFAVSGEESQFGGGLYFGYIWNVNSGFNIGFEGYYDFIDVTVSQSVLGNQPLEEKINGIGGLRALPGFKITNNTQIYLELGWAYVSQEFTNPNPVKSSLKENTSGFRYGAGLQTMIYDNISLRVYYSIIDELAEASLSDTGIGKLTSTPTLNEFGVGVAYHFKM